VTLARKSPAAKHKETGNAPVQRETDNQDHAAASDVQRNRKPGESFFAGAKYPD